jgi:hypothetical protein
MRLPRSATRGSFITRWLRGIWQSLAQPLSFSPEYGSSLDLARCRHRFQSLQCCLQPGDFRGGGRRASPIESVLLFHPRRRSCPPPYQKQEK